MRPWGRRYGRPRWTALPDTGRPIRAAAALGQSCWSGGRGPRPRAPALAVAREEQGGATDVPPEWLFAASGVVVAGVGASRSGSRRCRAAWSRDRLSASWGVRVRRGREVRARSVRFFRTVSGGRSRPSAIKAAFICVTAFGVLVLYLIAIRFINQVARTACRVPGSTGMTVTVVLSLAAVGLAVPSSPPWRRARTVVLPRHRLHVRDRDRDSDRLASGSGARQPHVVTAEDRAQILARASILTTIASLAITFVVLFQALSVVFMLRCRSSPVATVTPK